MRNLFLVIAAAIVVLAVILRCTGYNPLQGLLSLFIDNDADDETDNSETKRQSADDGEYQKPTSEPVVEMATLVRKSDDRLRVIESTGQVQLIDEKYELVFLTRKGQNVKIICSREAYDQMPFNQQGSLTYKMNTLVKFKYYEDTIYN